MKREWEINPRFFKCLFGWYEGLAVVAFIVSLALDPQNLNGATIWHPINTYLVLAILAIPVFLVLALVTAIAYAKLQNLCHGKTYIIRRVTKPVTTDLREATNATNT
jgi:hypothetical protein